MILEKLRNCRRINSPRTKKSGAIYIVDRRTVWEELNKQLLINLGYLTEAEKKEIDVLLSFDSYPKTYSQEWIKAEHLRLESEVQEKPLLTQLELDFGLDK